MPSYDLLLRPSANRVYSGAAPALVAAELAVLDAGVLGGVLGPARASEVGGVPALGFTTERPLDPRAVAAVSTLSAAYALLERVGPELLRPVRLTPLAVHDDSLVTTLRYVGKTNEQFTQLLLNVTAASTAFAAELLDRPFTVLDPMCGRGTTLLQALRYGWSACGLDVDGKDVEALDAFVRTWLTRARLKHTASLNPVRREKVLLGRRLEVALAADKDAWKAGVVQRLSVMAADTVTALEHFPAGSVDVVVTDAPYGVQHGSRRGPDLARSPLQLLEQALPVWAQLLRPGGALGLSWNTLSGRRSQVSALAEAAGLQVLSGRPYEAFEHRVDQGIVRDVLVARRPV